MAHDIPGLQLALAVGATTYLLRDRKRLSLRAPCRGRMCPFWEARAWFAVQDCAALGLLHRALETVCVHTRKI
jgi:hypothetical protein